MYQHDYGIPHTPGLDPSNIGTNVDVAALQQCPVERDRRCSHRGYELKAGSRHAGNLHMIVRPIVSQGAQSICGGAASLMLPLKRVEAALITWRPIGGQRLGNKISESSRSPSLRLMQWLYADSKTSAGCF